MSAGIADAHSLPRAAAELERLRAEYAALQAAAAEDEASDGVALHDAQLLKLELSGLLQRYRDRPPGIEDFVERYEAEARKLVSEVLHLREDNAGLAMGSGRVAAQPSQGPRKKAVRTAAEELLDEVMQLRRRHEESARNTRRSQLEERRVEELKGEARSVIRRLHSQEQRLEELRARHARADGYRQELDAARAADEAEIERERHRIRDLHNEAYVLREACYTPARLRKESNFLRKLLDKEGGRLTTNRHVRGLEACKRLYAEVAAQAPSLQPLAGRAKAEMQAEFDRYQRLEEAHSRALHKVHVAVARGLLSDRDGLPMS